MKGFFNNEEEDVNTLENKHPKRSKPQVFDKVISGGKKVRDYTEPNIPPATPCQCKMEEGSGSIFCNRHQCIKSKSLHSLCKNRMAYFEMWENGEGPMQDPLNQIMVSKGYRGSEEDEEGEVQEQTGFFKAEVEKDSGFFMGDIDIPSESRGLGDTLAKITKVTGVKKVIDTVFDAINKDCGCRERQSKLNKLFPYKKEEANQNKTKGFFE
tara:strand:- start:402 stop:1034 length:633 start_codon:yes stop_codon:yes gene_type:complete